MNANKWKSDENSIELTWHLMEIFGNVKKMEINENFIVNGWKE